MPRFSIVQSAARPRSERKAKPRWLKVQAPLGPAVERMRSRLEGLDLHTVCEEAQCPNLGECWSGGTATIMLMGGTCTRGCRFCHVLTGRPAPLDPDEPTKAARAVARMDVRYIVLTSVNRDDLPDGGADHFACTVDALRAAQPGIMVETLIPDLQGRLEGVDRILESSPEVIAHNVETVPRLSRSIRDARASFEQSLRVLERVHVAGRGRGPKGTDVLSKTSIMCGLGESEEEVVAAMERLRTVSCDVITLGQYLQPTPRHHEVREYVEPARFDRYADLARQLGFLYVASGPLVRSSYRAAEYYLAAHLGAEQASAADRARDQEAPS